MKYEDPILTNLKCRYCGLKWDTFLPDGIDSRTYECPRCGERNAYESEIRDVKRNHAGRGKWS